MVATTLSLVRRCTVDGSLVARSVCIVRGAGQLTVRSQPSQPQPQPQPLPGRIILLKDVRTIAAGGRDASSWTSRPSSSLPSWAQNRRSSGNWVAGARAVARSVPCHTVRRTGHPLVVCASLSTSAAASSAAAAAAATVKEVSGHGGGPALRKVKPPSKQPKQSSLLLKAGLPFILFSVMASWVVSNALDGKLKEMEASQGRVSKSVRQAKLEEEQAEIMERIGFIAKQDFDNTKRIKRPHEILEERRLEREKRNAWHRRAWRYITRQPELPPE